MAHPMVRGTERAPVS